MGYEKETASETCTETTTAEPQRQSSGRAAAAPPFLLGVPLSAGNGAIGRLMVQRTGGDLGDRDLLLNVMFGGTTISWDFPVAELDRALVENLRADPARVAVIEKQIVAALHDDAGPMHESQTYLQSPPVADDLRQDLTGWPATKSLPRFTARFAARAAAVRNTRLRYPLEQSLEASGVLHPGDIDWTQEVAALRGRSPGPDNTVIDAMRNDRFELALSVLEREATTCPDPTLGLTAHPDLLGPLIYAKYAATDPAPSELQTDAMTKTHSEAFLTLWLPTIRDVRLIPDDLDLTAFEPAEELDQARHELLTRYISGPANRTMQKYLLDRWVVAGLNPEDFVRVADITALRGDLIDHLAKDFPRWAATQQLDDFRGAFWTDAGQRAAFTALKTLVLAGRSLQTFHAGLADRFATVGADKLSPEEFAIAQDPYGYSQKVVASANVTSSLTRHLKPGGLLEQGLLGWYEAIASVWSMGGADARPTAYLLAVFQAIGGLKSAVEAQRAASRAQIALQLDTSYDRIAALIKDEAYQANLFIKSKWIPMLKAVAIERITRNRDEMKQHIARWPQYRKEASAKFRICAHFLGDLVTRLQSGEIDSITMDGQVLTAAHLPQLKDALEFMKGQADALDDDEKAESKKDDMQDALEGFEKVRKRIANGDYKPIDYSKAVYQEARERLGIAWYENHVTLGMALDRWAIVPENPFLAYAIARWQWEERVEQLDREFLVFLGLGLLTVASLLVPGAAGLVIGGVDLAVGIAQGVSGVVDAYALLDLAKLDTNGTVRGVTVEQARAALRTAWIGLGINLLLVGGLAAVWAALKLAGRGAGNIPAGLERLSELAKVDPVLAEKMMSSVKDLPKLEELLGTVGDARLLSRMLDRTGDVRHLEYALMFAEPRKVIDLLDMAGDAGKLAKVLDHVPNAAAAQKLMSLTPDTEGLVLLLRSADNVDIAESLLRWTDPRTADRLIGLSGSSQGGLPGLSTRGLSPETVANCLQKCESSSELNRLLDRGIKPSEIEMGVGIPNLGTQPAFTPVLIDMPQRQLDILAGYGVADHPSLLKIQQHELTRINSLAGGGLKKELADVQQKGAKWAADGATSPGNFVDRWEFFKIRVEQVEDGLPVVAGQSKVARKSEAANKVLGDIQGLNTILAERARSMRDLGGIGWADLGAVPNPELVRSNATRLTFGSDANAAYHPSRHIDELPLAERPKPGTGFDEEAAAYLASARRTVAEGDLAKVTDLGNGASSMIFVRTGRGAGDAVVKLETIVIVRDQWALIASYGKAKSK